MRDPEALPAILRSGATESSGETCCKKTEGLRNLSRAGHLHPPALLLSIDRLLGLQLARILWRRKVPVFGTANNLQSQYCRTRAAIRIVPTREFLGEPESLLRRLTQEYGRRPVIIPCGDDAVWWLSDNRELVAKYADFLIPPAKTLELLSDKSSFYRYAMEHHLPLPPTRFVHTAEELETAIREMSFPILMKPPRKTDEWMQMTDGFKVLKVDEAEPLRRMGNKLLPIANELILQQWVPGPDANMHSLCVCLDRQSNPLIPSIVSKKIRQWPPDVGVGSLAMETQVDEVVKVGLGVLQKLGYAGPGSFQFKQDEVSKTFYIIEMNTRSSLNFPLYEACGIEATYTGYCAAAGLPLPETRTVIRPGSKWICWKTDLPSAYAHWMRGDLTVREWLASLRGHKRSADIQLDDPMPLLADIVGKIATGLSPRSRKVLKKD